MNETKQLSDKQAAQLVSAGRKRPRARNAKGSVNERGKGKNKYWRGDYYIYIPVPGEAGVERREHRATNLGLLKEVTRRKAENDLSALIEKEQAEASAKSTPTQKTPEVTFDWFWHECFVPAKKSRWAAATKYNTDYIYKLYIKPFCGDMRLIDIEKLAVQTYLDGLADKGYGVSTVKKTRRFIVATLDEAVEQDYLTKNQAKKVHIPKIAKRDKPYADVEQIAALSQQLYARDWLIVRLSFVCALRRSEIFALRWNDFLGDAVMIDESVWRTVVNDEPKTDASKALVYLPTDLQEDLKGWRDSTRLKGRFHAEAFMFESKKGTPMYADNFLRRILKPAAERAGMKWFNFRAARRSCATLLNQSTGIKDVQSHLRHASPDMTLGTYVQAVPVSVREAVEGLDQKLRGALNTQQKLKSVEHKLNTRQKREKSCDTIKRVESVA